MRLQGSICALVTPFGADAAIDFPTLGKLIDWHVDCGTQALVIAGSTGEAALLDDAEYRDLIAAACDAAARRVPIIAGIGSPSTKKSLALAQMARDAGADVLLAVTPYYVRPTQQGLLAHYQLLAGQAGLPVVLYNVPGRTGCDLLPETVAELSAHPAIVGIKEAVADAARMRDLLVLARPDFAVLSGDDPTAVRAMLAGASGTISVAANVVPRSFARLCALATARREVQANALDRQLQNLYAALGAQSNPIPAKWLMRQMGQLQGTLRLPLHELSESFRGQVDACLADIHACEATMAAGTDGNG
jgi:4-hydroxy-tetrahydrodipicolinate synthase